MHFGETKETKITIKSYFNKAARKRLKKISVSSRAIMLHRSSSGINIFANFHKKSDCTAKIILCIIFIQYIYFSAYVYYTDKNFWVNNFFLPVY